ncbi:hypothetical protein [Capnocytophaga gingivalis]|uniref:hypothetical protein n=1 Tax=Capnocytophaga gingivalis TaxID=1017 RepID=UPI0028D8D4A3|nr:hypothetical protein [Capnocytophaga gingivalis]
MVSIIWTKFTHIPFIGKGELPSYKRGRIVHNGWVNYPHTQLRQLADFAPTRALSERWQILYANSITGMA